MIRLRYLASTNTHSCLYKTWFVFLIHHMLICVKVSIDFEMGFSIVDSKNVGIRCQSFSLKKLELKCRLLRFSIFVKIILHRIISVVWITIFLSENRSLCSPVDEVKHWLLSVKRIKGFLIGNPLSLMIANIPFHQGMWLELAHSEGYYYIITQRSVQQLVIQIFISTKI